MTTAEMIFELEQMSRTPDLELGQFFSAVSDRLDRLEKLKNHFLDAEAAIQHDPGCKSEPS